MSVPDRGGDEERGLGQVLWQLRDFLPDLILIGGWVPHLYRRYGGFPGWEASLSGTYELDLLVAPALTRPGGESLPEALARARFEPSASGAIWEGGSPRARIEFMVAHRGTAQGRNEVVQVAGQPGLGAISLEGLSFLSRFSTSLAVPVGRFDGKPEFVQVRLPSLGAWAANKAVTFPYRPASAGDAGVPKRAKDILYLRDLMAAGHPVVVRIETDLRQIARAGGAGELERAKANVHLLLHGELRRHLAEAGRMLAERERMPEESATFDVEGHITDLYEVLDEVLR